ncbi:hypothetical protein N7474_010056 [Penicillium riverlandense]|uniref:uncharacterized protein n=1 Tax=Penicillium riverlandense TaxID=1903569 RepID=UPI002546E596|nr:uncharacterized protein N7474_010056 [Penicillium riverlandense]KAJ5808787.1 hypothetical protein N7474_010056 [Penicillium riverlandense]
MPFYGRPSKNCESCRERRIKASNLNEPVCSQCKRAGKPCGGYRVVTSLMFRDENDRTVRRSAVAESRSKARRKLLDSEKSSSSPEPSVTSQSRLVVSERKLLVVFLPTIPAVVSSSVEEQGLNFFFHRFVTAVSMLERAPPQLEVSPFSEMILLDPPVRDAAVSVGLAAKYNVTRDRALHLVARENYAAAISSLRVAVENPERANPEQTLRLIVMLGLYEMVSCTPNQVDSWTVHLDGAAALLKQSTFNQALKTFQPRPQLQYYYVSIVKYFIAQGNSLPDLLDWSPDTISISNPDEQPAIRLIDILIRFMRLHSSIRTNPDLIPETAVHSALAFESELDQWEKELPEKWAYVVKDSNDTQNTFNGKYVAYDDLWASRDLNNYFWARLMVNETILSYLSRSKTTTVQDLWRRQLALDTISQMATFICASAASQMGALGCRLSVRAATRMLPLNEVFMLMFPLAVAGGAAGAPDEVHEWVVQRLQKIGSTMGIQHALEMIPKLKQAREAKLQRIMECQ